MSESFQVGEIAIVVPFANCPIAGHEVEIIEPAAEREWEAVPSGDYKSGIAYVVRHPDFPRFCIRPPHLKKKRLPPPREDVGSWDLCPWQPAKERVL